MKAVWKVQTKSAGYYLITAESATKAREKAESYDAVKVVGVEIHSPSRWPPIAQHDAAIARSEAARTRAKREGKVGRHTISSDPGRSQRTPGRSE